MKDKLIKLAKQLSQPICELLSNEFGVYKGQWTVYALVYGVRALYNNVGTNLTEEEFLQYSKPIVDNLFTKKAVEFDTKYWRSDVEKDLFNNLNKDHLASISLRAWTLQMISKYDKSYETLRDAYIDGLAARYMRNDYNLLRISRANYTRFVPDNLIALAVLDNSPRKLIADKVMCHLNFNFNKLLPKRQASKQTSGAYAALSTYYLSLFQDRSMAKAQWNTIKKTLLIEGFFTGIAEGNNKIFGLDGDGGPIVNGISTIATAYSIGPSRIFGDTELSRKFEMEGENVRKLLSLINLDKSILVGPAVLLSMISEK